VNGRSNLLEILGGCVGEPDMKSLAERYVSYGALKRDVADAVIALLEPLQNRYAELADDPGAVDALLRQGAERASELAAPTVTAVKQAIGVS
jgi:tryptophanyl-tRNA synthetase